jgi:type I restriction enzyme S subunit
MSLKYKSTPIGALPNEWKVLQLDEIGEFKNGINKGKEDFGHGFPMVNLNDVFGVSTIDNKNLGLVNSTINERESYSLIKGDVLFIRSSVKPSGVGLTATISCDMRDTVYSGFIIRFRDNGVLDLGYKRHCFYEKGFRDRLLAKSTVSANTNINQNALNTLPLAVPPLPEQQKIAEILSTVDAKIEVIDQQITETQELKKGLMQRLLTKGIGHTEFKDSPLGKIPKSWEVVKCDSIADITSSKRVYLSDYTDCGIPFYRGKEITQLAKGEKLNDLVYIKEDTFIEFKNRFGAPKGGDILITAVGTIGSIYMVKSTDNFYFKDGNLMWLRGIDSRLNRQFIAHYFRSIIFQNLIDIISSGSSQKALTIVKFKLLPVVIPSLDEQMKISEILDIVYKKISILEEKKVNYQELKQGLMQQLLTGKIRVKV